MNKANFCLLALVYNKNQNLHAFKMIKNYIKLYLTHKNTVCDGMFYGHAKLFSDLGAPCTFYQMAAQCFISQHAFCAQCQSYCGI